MGILDLDPTNPADMERLKRALASLQELGEGDRDKGAELHARYNTVSVNGKYRDIQFPPYQYTPYPKVVYFLDGSDRIVRSAEEHQRAGECYESPEEAKDAKNKADELLAAEAAHLAYEDRNLTGKAKAEREAADALAEDHLVDVQGVLKGQKAREVRQPQPAKAANRAVR